MSLFNVHVFRIVHIKIDPIEADNMEQAIDKAEDLLGYEKNGANAFYYRHFNRERPASGVEIVEDAEETSHYLVDIKGDEDYEKSIWFKADGKPRTTWENKA